LTRVCDSALSAIPNSSFLDDIMFKGEIRDVGQCLLRVAEGYLADGGMVHALKEIVFSSLTWKDLFTA
jgi:hypothetical protein